VAARRAREDFRRHKGSVTLLEPIKERAIVEVNVVAALISWTDQRALRDICSYRNWNLQFVENLQQALSVVRREPIGVVISDVSLSDGSSWKHLLQELDHMLHPPPLIVSDRLADDLLWAEVLNLGGYDLLVKPFDTTEVFRIVSLAFLSWKRRVEGAVTTRKGPAAAHRESVGAVEPAAAARPA
jgi:DNA-binding response OmpR family regulator